MKRIITLALMILAITGVQASVVISEADFPDEAMRFALIDAEVDADGDGIRGDEKIEIADHIYIQGCKNLKGLELLPKLASMADSMFNNVHYVDFYKTGIQDIDMSNHPTLGSLPVKGDDEDLYELNAVNVPGCDNLWGFALDPVKLQSVRLNAPPARTTTAQQTWPTLPPSSASWLPAAARSKNP